MSRIGKVMISGTMVMPELLYACVEGLAEDRGKERVVYVCVIVWEAFIMKVYGIYRHFHSKGQVIWLVNPIRKKQGGAGSQYSCSLALDRACTFSARCKFKLTLEYALKSSIDDDELV